MASSWVQELRDQGSYQALQQGTDPLACFVPRKTGSTKHYYVRGWTPRRGWLPATHHRDPPILPVWADGACRFNGRPNATSGVGVMVGAGRGYSYAVDDQQHTSQRAEIHAAIEALYIIRDELYNTLDFNDVVIVMDSEYVVKGITEWVITWERNGWLTYNGRPVANEDLWTELLNLVDELQDRYIGTVYFYQIPREYNHGEDNLAKQAVGISR